MQEVPEFPLQFHVAGLPLVFLWYPIHMDDELYREIILDHYRFPRQEVVESPTHVLPAFNPLCGDELILSVKVENHAITAITFEGRGCAISQASASMLCEALRTKSLEECKNTTQALRKLVLSGEGEDGESLGDLEVLGGVHKYPTRIKCALLSSSALEEILE